MPLTRCPQIRRVHSWTPLQASDNVQVFDLMWTRKTVRCLTERGDFGARFESATFRRWFGGFESRRREIYEEPILTLARKRTSRSRPQYHVARGCNRCHWKCQWLSPHAEHSWVRHCLHQCLACQCRKMLILIMSLHYSNISLHQAVWQ